MKNILVGFLLCLLLVSLLAVTPFAYTSSGGTIPVASICCSDEGSIVYVFDGVGVWKSEDSGANFKLKWKNYEYRRVKNP